LEQSQVGGELIELAAFGSGDLLQESRRFEAFNDFVRIGQRNPADFPGSPGVDREVCKKVVKEVQPRFRKSFPAPDRFLSVPFELEDLIESRPAVFAVSVTPSKKKSIQPDRSFSVRTRVSRP
jgi:hypothetical protein